MRKYVFAGNELEISFERNTVLLIAFVCSHAGDRKSEIDLTMFSESIQGFAFRILVFLQILCKHLTYLLTLFLLASETERMFF